MPLVSRRLLVLLPLLCALTLPACDSGPEEEAPAREDGVRIGVEGEWRAERTIAIESLEEDLFHVTVMQLNEGEEGDVFGQGEGTLESPNTGYTGSIGFTVSGTFDPPEIDLTFVDRSGEAASFEGTLSANARRMQGTRTSEEAVVREAEMEFFRQ